MSHSSADAHDSQSTSTRASGSKSVAGSAIAKLTPDRPTVTYRHPRPTVWFVIRRTWERAIAMQVWDVAATMTFYLLSSVLPALIALTSIVSLVNFTEETIWAFAGLVNDLLPAVEESWVVDTLFSLINTPGGLTALTLGLIGSLYSASNVVAAFHRAMNRIYDTREGRPLIHFRFVVFLETLVLMFASLALLLLVILGGDFSRRVGEMLGFTQETIATWNVLKWPLILVVLIFLVSQAFYRGPNVQRPRYRVISGGAVFTVIVLFTAIVFTGWLLERIAVFEQLFNTVNGILYVIVMVWLAFIIMLAAAAWDAEMLRARQLASGLAAADELQLATEHTWVLRQLDAEAANRRHISQIVVENYHTGHPVTLPKTAQLTEAERLWAVKEPDYPISTGTPFHAATQSSVHESTNDGVVERGPAD